MHEAVKKCQSAGVDTPLYLNPTPSFSFYRNVTPYKQADPVCMGYRNIANPVLASVVPNAQDQRAVIDYK